MGLHNEPSRFLGRPLANSVDTIAFWEWSDNGLWRTHGG
jgi:hypothetical protein